MICISFFQKARAEAAIPDTIFDLSVCPSLVVVTMSTKYYIHTVSVQSVVDSAKVLGRRKQSTVIDTLFPQTQDKTLKYAHITWFYPSLPGLISCLRYHIDKCVCRYFFERQQ